MTNEELVQATKVSRHLTNVVGQRNKLFLYPSRLLGSKRGFREDLFHLVGERGGNETEESTLSIVNGER